MLIMIRVDSSQVIGSGHVMRCLTLADKLKYKGAEVKFICRERKGSIEKIIKKRGYNVVVLPHVINEDILLVGNYSDWLGVTWEQDALETMAILKEHQEKVDWLIVDHYGIDVKWEVALEGFAKRLMVIDDLANRRHKCDLLLDQNLYLNLYERYNNLINANCRLFLGPKFVLLREEFYQEKARLKMRNGKINNILIFYGGSDITNETEKCLTGLNGIINEGIQINVVTGQSNVNRINIEKACDILPNVDYFCQISNIAELMNQADVSFGAGGTTTWERCFLGLPSVITIVAENQLETTKAVATVGAIYNMGWNQYVDSQRISDVMHELISNPGLLIDMQESALRIMGESFELDDLINYILK